jgi:cell division cycle 2-like
MASKGRSRWEDEEGESAEAVAKRRREKEEKKRAKEDKLRQADRQGEHAPTPPTLVNGDSGRPPKRLKASDEQQSQSENERDSNLLTFPAPRFGPCRNVEEYDRLNDIEEGSYGVVSRAREKATGTVVALKKLKMDYANDGFPVTGLREIQTLMASRHPHIVTLREVVMGSSLKE